MPIKTHDYKNIEFLEHIIVKDDGSPLQGEIDMYRRIYRDCEKSKYNWHFWHDVSLPIPVKGQSTIQIDFLLVCEKGVVVVEVKGGRVSVRDGVYYLEKDADSISLKKSPFDQANDYMYALINNNVLDKNKIFITTVCAFPHTQMRKTNDNEEMDLGWKLWSSIQQENSEFSFSDFCVNVIEADKSKKRVYKPDLSQEEVEESIKTLLYNFSDDNQSYSNASLESIIQWLQVDNLKLFDSLRKNQRLLIEGGPGTGKTTLAKAFINRFNDLRGLYVCWNKLLESKIRHELHQNGLNKCEVVQFASLLMRIQHQMGTESILSFEDINSGRIEKLKRLCRKYRESETFQPYNYIIIDEAQDVLDKGAVDLLQNFSFFDNGLESGSYMVFYDAEQGYNNKDRQIEGYAQQISKFSAHFILDENKRVPTNKIILDCAKVILEYDRNNQSLMIDYLQKKSYPKVLEIEKCKSAKGILNILRSLPSTNQNNIKDCVILAHSSTQKSDLGQSLYDRIATSIEITELNESNVTSNLKGIPFTSILRYKGLESKYVILVLNRRTYIDGYELYIGMTRAIINLKILILEEL